MQEVRSDLLVGNASDQERLTSIVLEEAHTMGIDEIYTTVMAGLWHGRDTLFISGAHVLDIYSMSLILRLTHTVAGNGIRCPPTTLNHVILQGDCSSTFVGHAENVFRQIAIYARVAFLGAATTGEDSRYEGCRLHTELTPHASQSIGSSSTRWVASPRLVPESSPMRRPGSFPRRWLSRAASGTTRSSSRSVRRWTMFSPRVRRASACL